MSAQTVSDGDPYEGLAAARKPLEADNGGRHTMVEVADELTGIITKAETVDGKYGKLRLLTVDPHRAISAGVDTTAAGEVEMRATGYELEQWYDREQPGPGDLISLKLVELIDTGKSSPMRHFAAALKRDEPESEAEAPPIGDAEADGIASEQKGLDDIPFGDAA